MSSIALHATHTDQETCGTPVDIVLVEDEMSFRALIETCLVREGYTVKSFPEGRSASEFLAGRNARLLVTDIFMPDGDGFELLTRLRATHPGLVSIVMSGRALGDYEIILKASRHLGARHALKKPFQLMDLVNAVRDVIGTPEQLGIA